MKNNVIGLLFCFFFGVELLGMETPDTSYLFKQTVPAIAVAGLGLYTTKRLIQIAYERKDNIPLCLLLGIDGIIVFGMYKILNKK